MKKYENIINNITGTFPDATAQNVSVPGAGDGTEFVAAVVDDIWGWHQALLDYAGMDTNEVTEAAGASQMVEALKKCFGHPGEVVMWHGVEDDPYAEFGCKLIPLEGQCIQVAAYPDLVEAVYCGDGNNATYPVYYRCDNSDGSVRNTAGAYLKLAEMRGMFVRGYDPTAEYDPDGATRRFPGWTNSDLPYQPFAMQEHIHEITCDDGFAVSTCLTEFPAGIEDLPLRRGGAGDYELIADTITEGVKDAVETRAMNVQVKFCIRY